MEEKRFRKNDSGFLCLSCGKSVPPLGRTSRNHCPFCLCSLHVDVNPGDRAAGCGGIMDAVKAIPDPRAGFILVHRCRVCGALRRCKAAYGNVPAPDDVEKLIALTAAEDPE